ncbi:ELWxxDGT repeat-containing protein [Prosthecobacter debontii]|uniref:ELWxxDGT repeat-containing protein n=1 Tax=Prosthecobacter debontii TaxID=48467 RepID=A0A1T4YD63_9BACT|nr:ELWxxDGT repeat protein [Prosthecobacter debontii]SKA99762.1 ELWxxDGT repeat-containing protein [Prosthecobacter debontii]
MKKTHLFMSAFAALALFHSQPGFGQVADINTQPPAANNSAKSMVKVNPGSGEILIIAIDDPLSGSEIWRSDGTEGGTTQVRDIVTGSNGSAPVSLTTVGNRVYFTTTQPSNKPSLWVTDGQFSGTTKLMEFTTNNGPDRLTSFNGNLFFEGFSNGFGRELWRSNGTTAGTVQVQNINEANGLGSAVNHFFAFGNTLYFTATDGNRGREIWKTDGVNGASLLQDIRPGSDTPFLNLDPEFTGMNGKIYFVADTVGVEGAELWVTDGTATGAQIVKDLIPGTASSSPQSLAVMTVAGSQAGTYIYFSANDGTNGRELWRSDGITGLAGKTELIKDIRGGNGIGSNPGDLTVVDNTLFFTANDGTGIELFRSTGRTTDATRVTDINNAAGESDSNPSNLTPFGSKLVFTAVNSAGNLFLYNCPAPTGSIKQIKQFDVGATASHFTEIGGLLYFLLKTPVETDQAYVTELWVTDGENANATNRVKAFQTGNAGSSPKELRVVNAEEAYFSATDGVQGEELWKTDGSEEGTSLIKDIRPGSESSEPQLITPVDDKVFFTADDTGANRELWLTDGTEGGTVLVKKSDDSEIHSTGASNPEHLASINGLLYFAARGTDESDDSIGVEPWVADPATGIATLIANIGAGGNSSSPTNFVGYQSKVYFVASQSLREISNPSVTIRTTANGLDGPTSPTEVVVLGTGSSSALILNGNSSKGKELWKSNGTSAGTQIIDINPNSSSDPQELTVVGSFVYFSANNGTTGRELWRLGGTSATAAIVKDIVAGSGSSNPEDLIEVGGKLFFTADDGKNGRELWVSSGAAGNTIMVKNIRPGIESSNISNMRNVDGILCFSADDGVNGNEVWISDGTAAGTTMLGNIAPSSASSNPANFSAFKNQMLFSAADLETGDELRMVFIGSDIEVRRKIENAVLAINDTLDLGSVSIEYKKPVVSATLTITITNTGLNTLTGIKPLISGVNAAEFTLGSKIPATLSSGATSELILKFTPKEGGPRSATLSILSNDSDENPFVLQLAGTGDKDPTITNHPESLMVKVGQPATFEAEATGTLPLLPNWKKGSSTLKTETGETLTIPSVTIKDGGAYSYFVKGPLLTALSNAAELGVVEDFSPALVSVQGLGKSAVFKVNASGNQLTYQWIKDGVTELTESTKFVGTRAKVLTIKGLTADDTGLYTCRVTNPGGSQSGASTQLNVYGETPIVLSAQDMPDGVVGGIYEHTIKIDPDPFKAALTYRAKFLPPGLKLNAKTGEITGRPTKDGDYAVELYAKNTEGEGSYVVSPSVNIEPFPSGVEGIYAGTIAHNAVLNGNLGGRLDATITKTGAVSGSVMLGITKLAFKGAINVFRDSENRNPTAEFDLKPSAKTGLPSVIKLVIEIDRETGLLTNVSKLSAGGEEALIEGWRKLDLVTAAAYDGAYNFGLKLGDPEQQHVDYEDLIPQGWSFGTFKSAKGALKIAGRTADGDKITCASFVGVGGKVVFYQTMYKPLPGSIVGSLTIDPQDTDGEEAATDNTLTGQVQWVKPADSKSKTRTYVAGFGMPSMEVDSPVPLDARGAIYVKPTGLVLGLTEPGDLQLSFTFGGLTDNSADATIALNTGNKLTQDPDTTTATKLASVNASTGALSGSFALGTGATARKSSFFGQLITDGGVEKGIGFFTLPQEPGEGETLKTSPIFAGHVELKPAELP